MKTYDFKLVAVKDLDGKDVTEIHKAIGNLLFKFAENLDLTEIARGIYIGEPVELRPGEAKELRSLLIGPKSNLFAFVKKAIIDYMDSVEAKKDERG